MSEKGLSGNPVIQYFLSVLRGIGQACFCGSPITGALVLVGVGYSSWQAAAYFFLGAAASTLVAMAFGAPKEYVKIGLFGFAGGFAGVTIGTFLMMHVPHTPGELLIMLVLSSVLVVPVTMAYAILFAKLNLSSLAMPVITIVWLLLAGFLHGDVVNHVAAAASHEAAAAAAVAAPYTWETFVYGTLSAFGQLFMHGNPVTGAFILLGILAYSRIMGVVAVLACLFTIGVDWFVGFPTTRIADGELLFNSFLTAMALAGFFLYLDWRSLGMAFLGALLAQWVYIAAVVFLKPLGVPAMPAGFVLVTWIIVLGAQGLDAFTPVPLDKVSKPENCILKGGTVPA